MENIALACQVIVAVSVLYIWTFRYENIVVEFKHYGYSDLLRNVAGSSKISISAILLVGIWYTSDVVFMEHYPWHFMICAQYSHFKVQNPVIKFLPSLIFLIMSLFVAAFNYGMIQMEFANAIIAFTGISFLVYGFNYLFSKRMINEFDRVGLVNTEKIFQFFKY